VKRSVQDIVDALAARGGVPFAIRYPDGRLQSAGAGKPAFTIALRTRAAARSVAARGHMGLLDRYFDGDIDVEGDLRAALALGMTSGVTTKPNVFNRAENALHELRQSNRTREQAKVNARFHYDHPEAFYRLWLDDPYKMYTCAYWKEGTVTLEDAQRNKIDHVIRKIRLKPDDRFVDIGCGFGGFMFRALETVGATGVGVNNATAQVDWLRGEIARKGLEPRLAVREADFRDVDGPYDKVVSIGVLEHAGRDQIMEVVKAHADFLKPGGLGMLHFIGHVNRMETELFIRKHVFPGGWIPSLAETIEAMEKCGLEVVDIENLRRHYALTLDAWAERFDRNWEKIHALDPRRFDERFRRIWRVYLIGGAGLFRSPAGYTHLFQIVFSKGNITRENYPMSRAFLYA
jgi:cyclopropane-fatty-acyl-phospholipid synthase